MLGSLTRAVGSHGRTGLTLGGGIWSSLRWSAPHRWTARGMCTPRYSDFKSPFRADEIGFFTNQDVDKMSDRTKKHMQTLLKMHSMVHVHLTQNNTKSNVTDISGQIIFSTTAGRLGYKTSRRGSAVGAAHCARVIAQKLLSMGRKTISVRMKGFGKGREPFVKGLRENGLLIKVISDVTLVPYNGTRPRKVRRV